LSLVYDGQITEVHLPSLTHENGVREALFLDSFKDCLAKFQPGHMVLYHCFTGAPSGDGDDPSAVKRLKQALTAAGLPDYHVKGWTGVVSFVATVNDQTNTVTDYAAPTPSGDEVNDEDK
jgi:hypothetical protein